MGIGSKRRELLQLLQLSEAEIETVCKYLPKLSAYEEVTAQGRPFVLVHARLDHFSPARPLAEYDLEDFPFCRLDLNTAYFPDNPPRLWSLGTPPTRLLYQQAGKPDRIFHHGTMIGIDCGYAYPGGRLGCLCLDTMEAFYM